MAVTAAAVGALLLTAACGGGSDDSAGDDIPGVGQGEESPGEDDSSEDPGSDEDTGETVEGEEEEGGSLLFWTIVMTESVVDGFWQATGVTVERDASQCPA
jgi:hypothetical protein